MTTYTLYSNGVLERDGFYLPIDEFNPEYQEYLAWVALGNSPTFADGSVYMAKLADDQATRTQLKANYTSTLQDLKDIIDAAVPLTQNAFNAFAFQALKTLARILHMLLKIAAKRIL